MTAPQRPRGRPRSEDASDRRAQILKVARRQFAAKGYRSTSLRAIAAEAGVDVSLISHYFAGKAPLLVATMELPINPIEKISSVVADGPDHLAERLLTTFLDAWDPHRDVFSTLLRTTLGSPDAQAPMLQVAREVLLRALDDVLVGEDRELRASLIASQLIGLATTRYVVRVGALAQAPAADVVRLMAPAMQQVIENHTT